MIKTCPFCNASPVLVYRKLFHTYHVRCDTPGCELEFAFCSAKNYKYDCLTEEEAIARWNTRFESTLVDIQRRTF